VVTGERDILSALPKFDRKGVSSIGEGPKRSAKKMLSVPDRPRISSAFVHSLPGRVRTYPQ
jgi:hypothetical protein